jgi:hypothetical protein
MAIFAYLFRIDPKKWAEFMAAVRAEGHTAKWVLESLIDDYLTGPRRVANQKKKKKDKPDA